jgi:hypothetical protein
LEVLSVINFLWAHLSPCFSCHWGETTSLNCATDWPIVHPQTKDVAFLEIHSRIILFFFPSSIRLLVCSSSPFCFSSSLSFHFHIRTLCSQHLSNLVLCIQVSAFPCNYFSLFSFD